MAHQQHVIVIGGPTASGKSGLGLSLAKIKNGTIINADSVQIYNGLPLLTAQPSADDFKTVPHKLYSHLNPHQNCTAATWRDMAIKAIDDTLNENRLPIIVGGTGFYIKTLIHGISPIPDTPPTLRTQIITEHDNIGNDALYAKLKSLDPIMATRLHPSDTQRIIRALEVFTHTGKSLSVWQDIPPIPPPDHLNFKLIHLIPEKEYLYDRCNKRFHQMIDMGVLAEVKTFAQQYPNHDTQLEKALGYHDLLHYLNGDMDLDAAISSAQQTTRRYAKRQVTWFKHQMNADIVLTKADLNTIKDIV